MSQRKQKKEKAVYVCVKCDRTYFQVDRDEWDTNRHKYNSLASKAKGRHRCPRDERRTNK